MIHEYGSRRTAAAGARRGNIINGMGPGKIDTGVQSMQRVIDVKNNNLVDWWRLDKTGHSGRRDRARRPESRHPSADHPSVDDQGLTRNIAGVLGGEKQDRGGDVLDFAQPFCGDPLLGFLQHDLP